MTKVMACGDVMAGCEGVVRASTEDDLMSQVAEHAKSVHGLSEIDAETAEKVKAAIRDE